MSKIIHLDCTLRDGGYYNNWEFREDIINEYLSALEKINIDYVEIGFRIIEKFKNKGPMAYSEEKFLKKLKIPKKINIGIMVNASDLLNSEENVDLLIKKNFIHKKKSVIKLIRIACHFHELEKVIKFSKKLKELGYQIGINLMQISEKKNNEIVLATNIINKIKPKVLYFADSLGSLDTKKTLNLIRVLRKKWKGDLGIHTHDNMQNALKNSLEALKNGVKWIDTTVTGMGRGPGNTKTEIAILEFEKNFHKKINILPLLNLIKNRFKKLQTKYSWGTNTYYYLAGLWGIHPSFVQEMITAGLDSNQILRNLNNLKSIGGQKFNRDLINRDEQFYLGKSQGTWTPHELFSGKKVLILGSGPNLIKEKNKVEKFIKQKKPIVFLINNKTIINKKLIDYRLACHTMRILLDCKNYSKIKSPLIVPYQRFSERIKKELKNLDILDFGIEVRKNIFRFDCNSCVIPNSLAFSYALAIANSAKVEKIYLAGFDGYEKNDPKRYQMDSTIQIYKKKNDKIKLLSITPTKYKIKKIVG